MKITQEQADNMLKTDMVRFELYVDALCDYLELNQNQFDALVSFTYNCGSECLKQLTKNKTLGIEAIADRMLEFVHAGGKVLEGLKRRRKEERELFLTPYKEVKMFEEDEEKEALGYLVEKGRITDKDHWEKSLDIVKNQKYVIIKWANDVKILEKNSLL